MTRAELLAIAVALNGGRERGAQTNLANLCGVASYTVRRWLATGRIPEPTQRLIRALAERAPSPAPRCTTE